MATLPSSSATQAQQQQQQYEIQTLPHHIHFAHDHDRMRPQQSRHMHRDESDSGGDSGDEEEEGGNASNQQDVGGGEQQQAPPSLRASGFAMRSSRLQERKAQTQQSDPQQQTVEHQRGMDGEDDHREQGGGERDNAARCDASATTRKATLLLRHHAERSSHQRQPFGRNHGIRYASTDSEVRFEISAAGDATAAQQQPGAVPGSAGSVETAQRRKTDMAPSFAASSNEAAIQNEIRTMIAQTEQLLSGAQHVHTQAQQWQQEHTPILQPRPPPATQLHPSSRSGSTRLTLSDIMRRSFEDDESASNHIHTLPGLVHAGVLEDEGDESTEEDSVCSDLSPEVGARLEIDELSDGEMYFSTNQVERQRMHPPGRAQDQDGYLRSQGGSNDVDAETEDEEAHGDQLPSVSNRDVNVSKARALRDSMQGNLVRLGFKENLTRMALDAGVQEIEHYDSDCELAYVDIFMSLVKMVCDAHLDAFSHRLPHVAWMHNPDDTIFSRAGIAHANGSDRSPQTTSLPFKWPVFDMAQFEFGNARPGTCFDSVCVLTNLPKVSMDRTEELMEILSCNLFCMIGDPIQVVIPSVSATGRTKGHAFLEFDDHAMAKVCASAVDGLTWGRGPFGRVRSNMFRQYQVKSPTAPQVRSGVIRNELLGSARGAFDASSSSSTDQHDATVRTETFRFNGEQADGPSTHFFSHRRERFDDSFYTSSDDGDDDGDDADDDDDDDSDEDVVWTPDAREVYPYQCSRSLPRDISIDDMDIDHFEDHNVAISRHSLAHLRHLPETGLLSLNESHYSSDGDDDYEDDASWRSHSVLELHAEGGQATTEHRHHNLANAQHTLLHPRTNDFLHTQLRGNDTASLHGTGIPTPNPPASCDLVSAADANEIAQTTDESEKPWRSYCEELIARNREMQEQVAYARRRIVQLGHNNQKLHLLIDRVERDRDGLVFENDLLQTQLNGYEDHARHHEALTTELTVLRKRLKRKACGVKASQHKGGPFSIHRDNDTKHAEESDLCASSASLEDVRFVLQQQLSSHALIAKSVDELKDWEQLLESSLARVRATKEEKALELQKKLDRQVEEQQELKLCVICLSNDKSILCLPCRHLCLCESCSAREEVEKCPICRLHIDEMLLVYA